MKVAILGCGPAGLIAAHVASMAGAETTIYSKFRKSHLHGAQYMGAPIPGIEMGEPVTLRYTLLGSMDDYRRKVYGSDYRGTVSPEDFEGDHDAWDIRAMYDTLWDVYSDLIVDTEINPAWMIGKLPLDYDRVYSSIPKPALCFRKHQFTQQKIWVMGDADGIQTVPHESAENTIVCHGEDNVPYYRIAHVFGHRTVEWPLTARAHPQAVVAAKPIANDCDCWTDVINIGRYGEWKKGVLVHDAYERVLESIL